MGYKQRESSEIQHAHKTASVTVCTGFVRVLIRSACVFGWSPVRQVVVSEICGHTQTILRTFQLNSLATQKLVIPVEAYPQSGVNSGGGDDSVNEKDTEDDARG